MRAKRSWSSTNSGTVVCALENKTFQNPSSAKNLNKLFCGMLEEVLINHGFLWSLVWPHVWFSYRTISMSEFILFTASVENSNVVNLISRLVNWRNCTIRKVLDQEYIPLTISKSYCNARLSEKAAKWLWMRTSQFPQRVCGCLLKLQQNFVCAGVNKVWQPIKTKCWYNFGSSTRMRKFYNGHLFSRLIVVACDYLSPVSSLNGVTNESIILGSFLTMFVKNYVLLQASLPKKFLVVDWTLQLTQSWEPDKKLFNRQLIRCRPWRLWNQILVGVHKKFQFGFKSRPQSRNSWKPSISWLLGWGRWVILNTSSLRAQMVMHLSSDSFKRSKKHCYIAAISSWMFLLRLWCHAGIGAFMPRAFVAGQNVCGLAHAISGRRKSCLSGICTSKMLVRPWHRYDTRWHSPLNPFVHPQYVGIRTRIKLSAVHSVWSWLACNRVLCVHRSSSGLEGPLCVHGCVHRLKSLHWQDKRASIPAVEPQGPQPASSLKRDIVTYWCKKF